MEKKYEIEGIGVITEDYLKEEYNREYKKGNIDISYEEWKNDILNDPRSAIKEVE
jgi:hypothetical protein